MIGERLTLCVCVYMYVCNSLLEVAKRQLIKYQLVCKLVLANELAPFFPLLLYADFGGGEMGLAQVSVLLNYN